MAQTLFAGDNFNGGHCIKDSYEREWKIPASTVVINEFPFINDDFFLTSYLQSRSWYNISNVIAVIINIHRMW